MKKILFLLLIVSVLIAACMPSQEQIDEIVNAAQQTAIAQITVMPAATQDVNVIVQATFQSLTLTAQVPPPAGGTGSISGTLSYPSEGIPPLMVVAFNVNTDFYYWVITTQNQQTYQIDNLPAGTYHVFAYLLPDGSFVGAYDQFYLCGLNQACTDFTLVDVVVQAGAVTPNINPGDWYGDSSQWPPMPNDVNIPSQSGGIAGQLSYPSNFIPAQTIVAFDVNGPAYYYVTTAENQNSYQIDNLPAGSYYVVAYLQDGTLSAGYSQAVLCGLLAECTDHSLVPVNVVSGNVTNGVNPQDWYAPPGSFPDSPLP
jgi:hypothetical protein